MAPSSGHLLVPKAVNAIRFVVSKTASLIRSQLQQSGSSTTGTKSSVLQPIPVRVTRQSIHPIAFLRQSRSQQSRWFSTTLRNLSIPNPTARSFRSSYPVSRISQTVTQRNNAPFASTLRPNLTGGCLPRTAGGYSTGGISSKGGIRHFSHTPTSQAQVVNNVSAAMRAFLFSGQKPRYNGIDPYTGEKRWRSVSTAQDKALQMMSHAIDTRQTMGTTLEFALTPTITALSPLSTNTTTSALNELSIDFARALSDLGATLASLTRLNTLGALPVSLSPTGTSLLVRFPGCDAPTVSRLCAEVNITRGIIREDPAWHTAKDVEMALLFPFAPTSSPSSHHSCSDIEETYFPRQPWEGMLSPLPSSPYPTTISSSPKHQIRSASSAESYFDISHTPAVNRNASNPWADADLRDSDYADNESLVENAMEGRVRGAHLSSFPNASTNASAYEGMEGIYRFLTECEGVRR